MRSRMAARDRDAIRERMVELHGAAGNVH